MVQSATADEDFSATRRCPSERKEIRDEDLKI
jgi:hypothetical protein